MTTNYIILTEQGNVPCRHTLFTTCTIASGLAEIIGGDVDIMDNMTGEILVHYEDGKCVWLAENSEQIRQLTIDTINELA